MDQNNADVLKGYNETKNENENGTNEDEPKGSIKN